MAKTENVGGTIFEEAAEAQMTLTLNKKMMKALVGARPGLPLHVTVRGVVSELLLRDDEDDKGFLRLTVRQARMSKDHENPVAEMFYEDDSPGGGAS